MINEDRNKNDLNPPQEPNPQLLPTESQPVVPANSISKLFEKLRKKQFIFVILGVGLVIIVAMILFLYSTNNTSQQANYIRNESLPSVIPSNTPVSRGQPLEKNINNILYTINENGFNEITKFKGLGPNTEVSPYFDGIGRKVYLGDQEKIFLYDLDSKEQKEIYQLSDQNFRISSFSVVGNKLYISLFPSNIDDSGYIDEFDMSSKTSRRIGPQENVLYGDLHYIFKTTNNDDVIASFGGDGCASYGEIRLVTASGIKFVTKTGGGCAEKPRYIGELAAENKIVLLSIVKGTLDEMTEPELDTLYTKDVYTGEEKDLLDLKPLSDKLSYYYVDQENYRIYLILKGEIWILNFANGQIENKVAISKDLNVEGYNFFVFHDNKLYSLREGPYTDNFNMVLRVADVTTGITKDYNWGKKYAIRRGRASILGFWQNQPLINLYILPK